MRLTDRVLFYLKDQHMTTRIEMAVNPGETERLAILRPLRAFNHSHLGDPQAQTIALLVRDEHSNDVIGGLYGDIFHGWLFIELLAIPEQARGQGVGSRLMNMAEAVARDRGCAGIWLDTFDFQAPAFYERHGFSQFGHLDNFPAQHQRFFYQKRLG
jgi:GNAT superfamily N-acetyltransferase